LGSIGHLATVDFENRTGAFASASCLIAAAPPAFNDLVAGNISLLMDLPTESTLAHRAQCEVANSMRSWRPNACRPLRTYRTVDEVGLKGLYVAAWYGLWAPKGTPRISSRS